MNLSPISLPQLVEVLIPCFQQRRVKGGRKLVPEVNIVSVRASGGTSRNLVPSDNFKQLSLSRVYRSILFVSILIIHMVTHSKARCFVTAKSIPFG